MLKSSVLVCVVISLHVPCRIVTFMDALWALNGRLGALKISLLLILLGDREAASLSTDPDSIKVHCTCAGGAKAEFVFLLAYAKPLRITVNDETCDAFVALQDEKERSKIT